MTETTTRGYKLFRVRKDGTLGPLFINKRLRVPVGEWLPAEDHPTAGYKHRPGWHATLAPVAPHLRQGGDRAWFEVELTGAREYERPESQGGKWVLGTAMRVLGPATSAEDVERAAAVDRIFDRD